MNLITKWKTFKHDKLKIHPCERSPAFIIGECKINSVQWVAIRKYEYQCKICGQRFKTIMNYGKHTNLYT